MDTMFLNSRNSKTFDPHRLSIDFSDKINLKRNDAMLLYWILAFTIYGEVIQK